MTDLFKRSIRLQVDALEIVDLRMSFKVEKTLKREPNTLELSIYNLSETSRKQVQKQNAFVKLIAGYQQRTEILFQGDVTTAYHTKNGPDWITKIQAGDGARTMRKARVSESFAAGTTLGDVLTRLAQRTGLNVGNLTDAVSQGNLRNALTQFTKGFAVSGVAIDELEKVAQTAGLEISVQDGALQFSDPSRVVGTEVALLKPDTGLVGSPEVGEKGKVKARALIQQKLLPGRQCKLESREIRGFFKIEKVTFTGDNFDPTWYADLELRPFVL